MKRRWKREKSSPVQYLIVVVVVLSLFGCGGGGGGSGSGTATAADPRIGFTYPDPADYSVLTWTDAFR